MAIYSAAILCEQRRLWRVCTIIQACISLRHTYCLNWRFVCYSRQQRKLWWVCTLVSLHICASKVPGQCNKSSIGATIAPMTSRCQIQDGGPHDFRSKMAAPTTSDPRWRPPRHQDGGPHEINMAAPVTRSVTHRRVSQRPRPREGSVTS